MKKWHKEDVEAVLAMRMDGFTWIEISAKFPGSTPNAIRKLIDRETRQGSKARPVKVLLLDIETAPMEVYAWALFDQNIGLNQIIKDWSVLSWSAKWVGSKEVMYQDVRGQKDLRDDKRILKQIWDLLDEADVVIGQNSIRFDIPKLYARFIQNGFPPPSSFRHIDTLRIAKAKFKFTSNKLEYTTGILCTENQKLKHGKFPGFELWSECLKGNLAAFQEMEKYNKMDVISLEEYYNILKPWDKTINFNAYSDDFSTVCSCGGTSFKVHPKNPYVHSNLGRYQRYVCTNKKCQKEHVDRKNLLSKEKRETLRK